MSKATMDMVNKRAKHKTNHVLIPCYGSIRIVLSLQSQAAEAATNKTIE